MIQFIKDNYQIISIAISCLACIVSVGALKTSKGHFTDSNRAKLVFNIIQQEQKLYLIVMNLGQTSAYDIKTTLDCDIENPVKNLHVVPQNTTFRYVLMESTQVSLYPKMKELKISAKYKDIYSAPSFRMETSVFSILELLKYTCSWNEKQHCFDISRI